MDKYKEIIKKHPLFFVLLISLIIFLSSLSFLSLKYQSTATDDFIGRNEDNLTDILDYHFIATNFALTNQFPIVGYLTDTGYYKIHSDINTDAIYLSVFKKYGPVASFVRPPLYPLLIGCIYKLFGYKFYYNQLFNIFLLSLIAALIVLLGYQTWGGRGFVSGLIGSILFLLFSERKFMVRTMDIEIFLCFVFFLICAFTFLIRIDSNKFYFFSFGFVVGLGLLTKSASLSFFPLVFPLYLLHRYGRERFRDILKSVAFMFAGIVLVILPYTTYINHIQKTTESSRTLWSLNVSRDMYPVEFNNWKEFQNCSGTNQKCLDAITYFAKTIYIYQCRTTKFLFITNSIGEASLHFNNEASIEDGDMRIEWMFIKNSFYRKIDTGQSYILKLTSFYCHFPSYLIKVPIARLLFSSSVSPLFYWLGATLWALYHIRLRLVKMKKKIFNKILNLLIFLVAFVSVYYCFFPFNCVVLYFFLPIICIGFASFKYGSEPFLSLAYPLLWICPLLFVLGLYGGERFLRMADPTSCLITAYYGTYLFYSFANTKSESVTQEEYIS